MPLPPSTLDVCRSNARRGRERHLGAKRSPVLAAQVLKDLVEHEGLAGACVMRREGGGSLADVR